MKWVSAFGFLATVVSLNTACDKTRQQAPVSPTAAAQILLQHTWTIDSMYFVDTTNPNKWDTGAIYVGADLSNQSTWQFLTDSVLQINGGGYSYALINDSTLEEINAGSGYTPILYQIRVLTNSRLVLNQLGYPLGLEISIFSR